MAADLELLKKIEAIEDEIEKIISSKAFITFIHLNSREVIENLWETALNYTYKKRKALPKEKIVEFDSLLKDYATLISEIKLEKIWFRSNVIEELYNKSKKLNPIESEFLYSLTRSHLYRKEYSLPQIAEYALKSTLEADTQRLRTAKNLPIEKPEASIRIQVPQYLLKDQKGNFDISATEEKEKRESNLKAIFSSISYIPVLQKRIFNEVEKISDHPFLYTLYPNKAKRAIWEATRHLSIIGAQFVYSQLARGLSPSEAYENGMEFVKTLPKKDPDMALEHNGENLWDLIRKAFLDEETMSPKDNKIMFLDILEGIAYLCSYGLAVPDIYFELEFRKSTEDETNLEGSDYSVDLFLLDDDGTKNTQLQETYVVTYTDISLIKIVDFATNGRINPDFYSNPNKKTFMERIDQFISEPVIEIFNSEENQREFIKTETLQTESEKLNQALIIN